jgi:hypothetical protein
MAAVGQRSEGEGFSREGSPRDPSLPRLQTENDKGKGALKIF